MQTDHSSIAQSIAKAAAVAAATPKNPEGKLRELVAPLWDEYVKAHRINLVFQPRDERILANGRPDTVFNRLILEYKKPNVIKPDNAKNRQLIAQVEGYIEDLAKEERWKEERLLGVAFDGRYFLFVRRVRRWIEEEPVPVSAESVERFLLTLEKLTSKAALVPDNLIRDFAIGAGSLNYIAANAIRAFYFALKDGVNERVQAFFDQWAMQFAEVHGAIENKKFDANTLFDSYGFKKQDQKNFDLLAFFFALDTYYGLLMKLLAYQVVGFYTLKDIAGLPLTDWEKLDSDALKEKLAELEDGGIFRSLGIRNFLEGDLLSWYLNDWNKAIEEAVCGIIGRLNQYDPETLELVPDETRDILKKLYQFLVPRQIRHDLGEFYTPDWLAERCLNQLSYGVKTRDLLNKRLLDPGCGSGTFVILGIKRAREYARLNGIDPGETLALITRNIVGFDLNPLAVISARTNYLLAIADLLKYKKGEITIPIYLCDSINPPHAKEQASLFDDPETGIYTIPTSVGRFRFPAALVQKADAIRAATNLLEDSVKRGLSAEKFTERARAELKTEDNRVMAETYAQLLELERKGINGIWARIIKNAFAPLFMGEFDLVAGNPPWVGWENLPQSYREQTKELWQRYGLFSLGGSEARLGGGKKDISMLMIYVAIDKYLKDKGKLCFVITQTVFKSQGAGDGFRRFQIGIKGSPFRIDQVDDMVDLQPFEGVANRTAVMVCTKGEATEYPVPYLYWKKNQKGHIGIDLTFAEVERATVRRNWKAKPIDSSRTGPWLSARAKALVASKKIIGAASYRGYAGAYSGGLNGIYWIKVLSGKGKTVEIENLNDVGEKKVTPIRTEIEAELVYPLLRGRDIQKWQGQPSAQIIVTQNPTTRTGFEEKWMKQNLPKTYDYFKHFEKELWTRQSSSVRTLMEKGAFYSMFAVSKYTFAPVKVVWKALASGSMGAVVTFERVGSKEKVVVPEHNAIFVPFEDKDEAHYFCALVNSSPASFIITGYVSWFFSAHVLENVKIPQYDKSNGVHTELARFSKKCHEKAELWGLTKEELTEIKASLEELK